MTNLRIVVISTRYPPSVKIINYSFYPKIRSLQINLNGLKHEKRSIQNFLYCGTPPPPKLTNLLLPSRCYKSWPILLLFKMSRFMRIYAVTYVTTAGLDSFWDEGGGVSGLLGGDNLWMGVAPPPHPHGRSCHTFDFS